MITSPFFLIICMMIGSGLLAKYTRRPMVWFVFVCSIAIFVFMLYAKIKLPQTSNDVATQPPHIISSTIMIMIGLFVVALFGAWVTYRVGKKLRPEQMSTIRRTGKVIRDSTDAKKAARKILRQANISVGDNGFSSNQRNAEWIVQFISDDMLTAYTVTMTQYGICIGDVARTKAFLSDRKVVERLAAPYIPRNTGPATHSMAITQRASTWYVTLTPKEGVEGPVTTIKVDATTHAIKTSTKS